MAQAPADAWVLLAGQWVRHNGSPVNPPPPPPPPGGRFAGDPNPTVSTKTIFGGSVKGGGSPTPWETAAGVPFGIRHRYWSGSDASALATPSGPIITAIGQDHAAGRIPLVSWHLAGSQWAAAAAGTYDTQLANFFGAVDELTKPTHLIVNHEPEGGNGNGQPDGNSTNYKAWMNHFRARLNAYRTAHPTGRKMLVFNGCLMAATFTGNAGGIDTWWPGDGVFDVLGIDGYAWDNSYSMPSAAMTKAFAYCADHNQPFGISEYGVRPTDPAGGNKIRNLYQLMTSGSYDCIYMTYFQVDGDAWTLTTGNGTYPAFISELKDTHSIRLPGLGF